jgi:flagellar assembly factor FliW
MPPLSPHGQCAILFDQGLPGFPHCRHFILADLKSGFYSPLKILLSTEFPGINFILYPHINGCNLLNPEAQEELDNSYQNNQVHYYSIVTVKEPNGHFFLSTNLAAPIVIDHDTSRGWQHILSKAGEERFAYPLSELSIKMQERRKESGIA